MTEWKRLFAESEHLFGGQKSHNVVEVSEADFFWVTNELKKFNFDEQDELKMAMDALKDLTARRVEND